MKKMRHSTEGFALLEALVAGALGLFAVYMIASNHSRMREVGRKVEQRGEVETLRKQIRDNLGCQQTTGVRGGEPPWAACPQNYVLKDKRGAPLFALEPDGTVKATSGFEIRAFCSQPAEGIVIEYQRRRGSRVVSNTVGNTQSGWTNLFHGGAGMSFCKDSFQAVDPEFCASDEVLVGIGQNKEPICRSIFDRAAFKICLQFSDHGCSSQVGPIKCTSCTSDMGRAAISNMLTSDWAADSNRYDPDCARVVLQRCDAANDIPDPGIDTGPFVPQVVTLSGTSSGAGCSAVCSSNQVTVGSTMTLANPGCNTNAGCDTSNLPVNCQVMCQQLDTPAGGGGGGGPGAGVAGGPGAPICAVPSPPPAVNCPCTQNTGLQWINGTTGSNNRTLCHTTCINRLNAGRNAVSSFLQCAATDPNISPQQQQYFQSLAAGLPGTIQPNQDNNTAIKFDRGKRLYIRIQQQGNGAGCRPWPNVLRYEE